MPKTSPDHFNDFDACIARDGADNCIGDLALADCLPIQFDRRISSTIGLCLRGRQREYGLENCLHERVQVQCEEIMACVGSTSTTLETRLDRTSLSPMELGSKFGTVELVITSRLHGALLALQHGVPALVIDQIDHGGKVSEVMRRVGWPWVFRTGGVEVSELAAATQFLLNNGAAEDVAIARDNASKEASAACDSLVSTLRYVTQS